MAILSFQRDLIAGNSKQSQNSSDVSWLVDTLKLDRQKLIEIEKAYHLEPHGHRVGNHVLDLPGYLIVCLSAITFILFAPFSQPVRTLINEIHKPILKTIFIREIFENSVFKLLQKLHSEIIAK